MLIWELQSRISDTESVGFPAVILEFSIFLVVENSGMCFTIFCACNQHWKYGKTKNQKNRTNSLLCGLGQPLRSFLLQISGTRVERSLWSTSHPRRAYCFLKNRLKIVKTAQNSDFQPNHYFARASTRSCEPRTPSPGHFYEVLG